MDLAEVWPVASGVLTELATQIVISVPGWTARRLRGSPEGAALRAVVAESVTRAFLDAAGGTAGDDAWMVAVTRMWTPAFTPVVCGQLLAALSDGSGGSGFRAAARAALQAAGADLAELNRVVLVEEFLYALPRRLFAGLRTAALVPDSVLRDVVGAMLQLATAAAAETALYEASPAEFREDLAGLLTAIETQALRGGLPGFVPAGAGIGDLWCTARVREGPRADRARQGDRDEDGPDPYALVTDTMLDERPVAGWPEIAARENRVVVLGDPGAGKSWLVRWEAAHLARAALDALGKGAEAGEVTVPVPARCDELAASGATSAVAAVCGYLAARYAVPERSAGRLRRHVTEGNIVLLLDALDELPDRHARQRLDELLGPWLADPRARFRVTSRIAGYTGLPAAASPGVAECELQPLTPSDVSGLITAWGLREGLASRLREHVSGSPLGEAARIPLIIALLCAIAENGEDLPGHTAGVYDRVLRRFLTQENRWPAVPRPEPTDIDRLTGILAPLAYHFASRPEGWTDRMPASAVMTVMRSLGPAFTELGLDAAALLRDLSVRAGVLIPAAAQHAGHNPPYLFLHRTIAEYLTACHLAVLPRDEWLDILRQHMWFDPDWRPVIALLGAAFLQQERPAEAVHLVMFLLGQPVDPFSQALYHAASAAAELPDPALLPADLIGDIAGRLVALLDSDPDRETAAAFLQRQLNRLPWPVTQALLGRLDATPGWIVPRILAASGDPRVIARLTRFMDTCTDGAEYVCTALKAHGAERYEREMLARFGNPAQRRWAASVLRSIPALHDIAPLLDYATDSDTEARLCLLHALGGRDDPRLLDTLRQMAADPEPEVRMAAADELARQSAPAAIQAVKCLFDDDDPLVRLRALRAVILDDRAELPEIIAFTRHASPYARACAARALGSRPPSPQAGQALRVLTTDFNSHVRGRAAQALAHHPGEETAAALIRLLDDQRCSRKASQALWSCDSPGTARLIQQWLEAEPVPERMAAAVRALEGMPGPEATAQLLGYLASWHEAVREAAAHALAGREDDSVGTALAGSLDDPSPRVRQAAVRALQSTPVNAELTTALLALLADEHAGVRAAAARALAISKRHPEVTAGLLRLLADEQPTVREAAAARFGNAAAPAALLAICALAGQPEAPELPLPRDVVEQLALGTYRALPEGARQEVLGELTQLRLAAAPYEVIRTNVSPDWVNDDILDLEIVIMLQGPNQDGEETYTYVKVLGASLKRMFAVMCEGRSFVSTDYGSVLFADTGGPPVEVREILGEKYNMQDTMDYPE